MTLDLSKYPAQTIFRAVSGLAAVCLFALSAGFPHAPYEWLVIAAGAGFTACLFIFMVDSKHPRFTLMPLAALPAGLFFGANAACWSAFIGTLAGAGAARIASRRKPDRRYAVIGWNDVLFLLVLQVVPVSLALLGSGRLNGLRAVPVGSAEPKDVDLMPLAIFSLVHGLLLAIDNLTARRGRLPWRRFIATWMQIGVVAPGVITFGAVVFASSSSYTQPKDFPWADMTFFAVTGGILTLLAGAIYRANESRSALQRQVMELSTINETSQVLSITLDLDNILTLVQQKIDRFFGVDNFYVALLDATEDKIWYPLAVKHGKRCKWASRPLGSHRFTDQVIRSGKPLQVSLTSKRGNQEAIQGDPTSADSPKAWVGVPLASYDRTLGCLAMFTYSDEIRFSESDVNLLSTLSGQISVAVQNALLYKREQRRASEMENLNRFSRLITASLDLSEVLRQVCSAVVEVGWAKHSAIFLFDPERKSLYLAHCLGLPVDFLQDHAAAAAGNRERLDRLGSGKPYLVPDFDKHGEGGEYIQALTNAGAAATGEFPLIVRDNRIGLLAVYYDEPHRFRQEEIQLLQTFAAQAAVAIANAAQYRHTDLALQKRADQLAQTRELITSSLIHDLRSPMSAVVSAMDIVSEAIPEQQRSEVIRNALRVTRNSTRRVLGLIDSLLDIANMQSGKLDLDLTSIDLHELVENVVVEYGMQASDYQIQLANQVETDLPRVNGDSGKLTRVVSNLLDNALKFTPAGGRIAISAEQRGEGEVAIKVCDTGPGIPEEFREKIFERFMQVPKQKARRRGSGLGLTFCRMAVEAHGGSIWAEAGEAGEGGSTFVFTLPVGGPPKQ